MDLLFYHHFEFYDSLLSPSSSKDFSGLYVFERWRIPGLSNTEASYHHTMLLKPIWASFFQVSESNSQLGASSPHNCRLPWPLIYVYLFLPRGAFTLLLDLAWCLHSFQDTPWKAWQPRKAASSWPSLVTRVCNINVHHRHNTRPTAHKVWYCSRSAPAQSPLLSPTHIVTTRLRQLKLVQTWKLNKMYSNEVGSPSWRRSIPTT